MTVAGYGYLMNQGRLFVPCQKYDRSERKVGMFNGDRFEMWREATLWEV